MPASSTDAFLAFPRLVARDEEGLGFSVPLESFADLAAGHGVLGVDEIVVEDVGVVGSDQVASDTGGGDGGFGGGDVSLDGQLFFGPLVGDGRAVGGVGFELGEELSEARVGASTFEVVFDGTEEAFGVAESGVDDEDATAALGYGDQPNGVGDGAESRFQVASGDFDHHIGVVGLPSSGNRAVDGGIEVTVAEDILS